jgi:hypothetical protein
VDIVPTPKIDERLQNLEQALIKEALKQKWQYKYAKFGQQTQSLFVHSINVFSVARTIGKYLFDLDDDELYLVCATAFLHDYQKTNETWQKAAKAFMKGIKHDESHFKHDSGTDEMLAKLQGILQNVSQELYNDNTLLLLSKRILNIIVYTHDAANRAEASKRKREVGSIDPLTKIVRLSDSIASIKELKDIVRKSKDPDISLEKKVEFDYHEISVVRGVISCFLNEAVVELMKAAGYIPLLYFGNGATYILIGEPNHIENPRKKIREFLEDQFQEFQKSDVYQQGISNAAIGDLAATKWPCIHLVREEDMPILVQYIANLSATNKKLKFGDKYYEDQIKKKNGETNKKVLDEFVTASGSSSRSAILADMTSDFNLLVYVFDFVKRYRDFIIDKDLRSQYEKKVNKWLEEYLGEYTIDSISSISHTSSPPERVSCVSALWKFGTEELHKSKKRKEVLLNGCISLLKKIVKNYSKFAPPLLDDLVSNQLLSEVRHLPSGLAITEGIRELSDSVFSRYSKGKSEKKRLCNLCGFVGEDDAPAGLFGDGSEKFTNFLPGGLKLGKNKKAQVCPLCMLEATIRAFYFPAAPHGTIFVLPDISISPSAYQLWSKTIDDFVRTEHLGMSLGKSWNMLEVYKALKKGDILDTSKTLINLLRPTKKELKHLAKFLSEKRESPDEIDYEKLTDIELEMSFEEIAKAHVRKLIEIDPYLMEEYTPNSKVQRSSLFTPSYCITFLRDPIKDVRDEANSTSALRTYLLSLILAEVFHARVVFMEGYQPLEHFELRGRVEVQMPAPAENALRNMGIGKKVETHQIPGILRKMASVVLISMSYVKNLGKDRLLRLMSMNRGAILRRAQMEAKPPLIQKAKRDLLSLLENIPAKVGEL